VTLRMEDGYRAAVSVHEAGDEAVYPPALLTRQLAISAIVIEGQHDDA
jgi:hypothetical protein